MHWERFAQIRTVLLILIGFSSLSLAAFLWDVRAGFAAVGVSALALEFLTGNAPAQDGRRA